MEAVTALPIPFSTVRKFVRTPFISSLGIQWISAVPVFVLLCSTVVIKVRSREKQAALAGLRNRRCKGAGTSSININVLINIMR